MAEELTSDSEKKKEDWMNSKWRPMMGWMYMLICTMDMVVFPVLWSLLQAMVHGSVNSQWQPLTLQGAGLFHIAMGGVLGLAAYGRTQEKLAGANNGGANTSSSGSPASSTPSTGFGAAPGGFSSPAPAAASTGFGSSSGFGTTTTAPAAGGFGSTTVTTVVTGYGGKPAPAPAAQPAI
jgi:hypothetical protein